MKSLIAVTGLALAISVGAAAGQTAGSSTAGGSTPASTAATSPASSPTPTPVTSPVTGNPAPVQSHLKNAVIQTDTGGKVLSPGFTTIDGTQRLSCSKSCTIFTSAMVQLSTTGKWAICAVVDGKNINPPCPFQGLLPQTGNYVTGNSQQSWPVSAGTHTIQTQVYVSSQSKLGNWQTTRQIATNQSVSSPGTN